MLQRLFLLIFALIQCIDAQSELTILQLIQSNSQLKTLQAILDANPKLSRAFSGRNVTFLAPTDESLYEFSQNYPDYYASLFSGDTASTVLQYHIVRSVFTNASELPPRSFYPTMESSLIRIDQSEEQITAGSGFQMANVTNLFGVDDGALALVDHVLLPPPYISNIWNLHNFSMLFPPESNQSLYYDAVNSLFQTTLLLPTEEALQEAVALLTSNGIELTESVATTILDLHLLTSSILSPDMIGDNFKAPIPSTLVNATIRLQRNGTRLTVKGPGNEKSANIIETDYVVQGGVMHVIDRVLLPLNETLIAASNQTNPIYPFIS